jgi:hypothetical protein
VLQGEGLLAISNSARQGIWLPNLQSPIAESRWRDYRAQVKSLQEKTAKILCIMMQSSSCK